jgi:hypothetical protein
MKIDITKSGLENIVLQVVEDNPGLSLTADQVTIGFASVIDGNPQNSEVTLTAVEGAGFRGSKVVKYTRLNVRDGTVEPVDIITVSPSDDFAATQVKAAAAMGLRFDEILFHDYGAPSSAQSPGTMGVSPKNTSVLYAGAGKTMTIVMEAVLEDEIVVDELNGFDPEA